MKLHKSWRFLILGLFIILVSPLLLQRMLMKSEDKFAAPKENAQTVQFQVGKSATLDGIANNLVYYGFIKDENAFKEAVLKSKDNLEGREGAIVLENGNSINTQAAYNISQSMTAWEIASILLNEGEKESCTHGCPPGLFYPEVLPGGEMAPTLQEQYRWVENYEDCVKAGGQTYSEQYLEKTGGPDHCVSPDGEKEFIKGEEGWEKAVGG
ncbi:hypothetical protein C4564_02855 [Candidatus Microgenomates bacterium]|nr:MAG: hypothetical protein C4564_02855 [Candidatus Microgenomates bacterium]